MALRIGDEAPNFTARTTEGEIDFLSAVLQTEPGFENRDFEGRPMGYLRPTGLRPSFLDQLDDHGIVVPPELFFGPGAGA